MDEKAGLPSYATAAGLPPRRRGMRRSRAIKFAVLGCMTFIVLAQWQQIWRAESAAPILSTKQLHADLETCRKLQNKPKDPIGLGREKNARYLDGHKPTLIKNATIWTGEPVKGTTEKEARAGKGWEWARGDVFVQYGLIQKVADGIVLSALPEDTIVFEADGRQLTTGIIDMHSHAGVFSLPVLEGSLDVNEVSDNITPWARSIDALMPLDPQIEVIKSGGVTTSLILPGSGNNFGGEAYLFKHAVGKADGREEISARDMLADPDRNWRYMKMACGENPKRVHGSLKTRPFSRMGESYEFRHAFEQARDLNRKQDDWCAKADTIGVENMEEYLPQEIFWESLGAALRGQVHINVHCYTIPDLEAMVDHTNEFEFPVRAFHHAHQTFLIPEILKRTWGGRAPASALFADSMYYKTESYIGSEYAGKILYDNGLTPVYVSDNPVISAQHVVFEAARGYSYGLPYHAALASVTTAPAKELGMGDRIGKIKPGYDADIVVWDSDPLSVGAVPVQVWIDGTAQLEDPVELSKPHSKPIIPDESLADMTDEPTEVAEALFSGVTRVLLSDEEAYNGEAVNVAITKGKISCIGACKNELVAAEKAGVEAIVLKNGFLHHAFTTVGGTLGLNEIDAERMTDNGDNPVVFSRGIDGLLLDSKKLHAASRYGVTRAISAPKFIGGNTHHGTSTGFLTGAKTSIEEGAVFQEDVALHYTFGLPVRAVTSFSAAFSQFRQKLIAVGGQDKAQPLSEEAFLLRALKGDITLALTIDSADGISSALRIKHDIENLNSDWTLNMAIIGGAEAHLVAHELSKAKVGVILSPLQSKGEGWDARRTLSGAPLTNGTNIDRLLDEGVKVAIGLSEDWLLRDMGLMAGTAYRNSQGRLSEKAALDLVSNNIYKILGAKVADATESGHFVVSEGSPLEIGSRVKAVGSGRDKITLYI